MSNIRSTTDTDYTALDDTFGVDDFAPEGVNRKPTNAGGFLARFVPVLRRPPALLLDVRTGDKDMAFDTLIETHIERYRKQGADTMAYNIADFMIRRLPALEAQDIAPEVENGLQNLTETVRMFEHIYIAQSTDGG